MKLIIAGGEAPTAKLASAAREATRSVSTIAEPAGSATSVTALAARLRELEQSMLRVQPDAVLVADDTDTALAAVLVSTKLGVPAASAGTGSTSPNGGLIAPLADERLPGPLGDWARSYTESR